MARNRTPKAKAEVSGAAAHDPQRFRDRPKVKGRPVGEPYTAMTESQRTVWAECQSEMPWLRSHHRQLLRQACVLAARLDTDPEFGVSAHQALSAIWSKLGATPVDESKVNYAPGDEEQPEDKFFGRPH